MTDAQLKKLAKENNFEPTYELLAFARLVLINAKIQDLKLVAINTRLAVEKEREACAKLVEADANARGKGGGGLVLMKAAERIRARGDVHAIDISQEHVDETAKDQHEPRCIGIIGNWGKVEWCDGVFPQLGDRLYTAPPKREWVGLTEEEAWGMLGQMSLGASVEDVRFVEAKLKEKNT